MDIIAYNEIFKNIINNAKKLIDRNIYKFLFILLYSIFINNENSTQSSAFKNLDEKIKEINDKYIQKENSKINKNYEKQNLINFVNFVKTQNNIYSSEILENIFIIIFSFAFKTKKENTFGKYIYNNIHEFKGQNRHVIDEWLIKSKINTNLNIKDLLENEYDLLGRDTINNLIHQEPLFHFLHEVYMKKHYKNIILKKKFISYINNRIFDFHDKIKDFLDKNQYIWDSGFSSINYDFESNKFFYDDYLYTTRRNSFRREKIYKTQIPLITSFFISVYIYYQIKNSKLMKYIYKSNDDLEIIPFVFDLSEAAIEKSYAGIIMSPLRIEPRISEIKLSKNLLKENGMLELAKVLIFNNKNIKTINLHYSLLKSSDIDFFNNEMGLFKNNSVEILNLSFNYLNENCSEYLANILSHLKKLKTINLSSNDLKSGISSFLITLKKLYRQRKTNLETLYLNKCLLDDIAYYELGELLKCKYCKLKNLYLNNDNIPSSSNFLKKLKKNRSLTEIYFNRNNICNNDTNDIMRVISSTNIESLYLYKNEINDFSQLLRIIYRTKIITKKETKNEKEKIIKGDSDLYNLDLSNNICYNKNKEKVELLKQCIDESTLYCLDISVVLYNNNQFLFQKSSLSKNYVDFITCWSEELYKAEKKYNNNIALINYIEIDKNNIIKNIKNNDLFRDIDDEIIDIIKNENAQHIIFLRKNADKLIKENEKILNEIIINGN